MMLDHSDTAALQDRLDQLEARAMKVTGASYACAHLTLVSRAGAQNHAYVNGWPDGHIWRVLVLMGPIRQGGVTAYPANIEATGPDPLSAIESAFSVLHQRDRARPAPIIDQQTCEPVQPVGAAS